MAWTRKYSGDEPVRVNKWLAQSGVCSRREAEGLIESGRVLIDGERVTEPGRKICNGETLVLDDRAEATLASKLTVILHKPVDIVSGTPEGNQIPAVRLLKRETLVGEGPDIYASHKLAPIGRLDQDSRGLLIMSEDGRVAKAVIGPDANLEKEYIVRVDGRINRHKIERLREGLELDGRKLKRADVKSIANQTLRFVLTEGRNRQIRRMCDLVDLRVLDLARIRIGGLELGDLPPRNWRVLSPEEIEKLTQNPAR